MKKSCWLHFLFMLVQAITTGCSEKAEEVKWMSYNCSMNRNEEGKLLSDLKSGVDPQIKKVAEILQLERPDVVVLLEFDYDSLNEGARLFQENYLSKSQNGRSPIKYDYFFQPPVNTGVLSGVDINNDSLISLPDDGFGYGKFPGQYGFVVFSTFPIWEGAIRTFQHFLWKDIPKPNFPMLADTSAHFFSEEARNQLRLSSKNHVDVPIQINQKEVHFLIAHPTPPVFDGPEDRNGKRNYDEIRFWADYVSTSSESTYHVDDKGKKGGLSAKELFVFAGDFNAAPIDGDSYGNAISQLLELPSVNQFVSRGKRIPKSTGAIENAETNDRLKKLKGELSEKTSFWGLRVDYLLPSHQIEVIDSYVFWPEKSDPNYHLIEKTSDHLPVVLVTAW